MTRTWRRYWLFVAIPLVVAFLADVTVLQALHVPDAWQAAIVAIATLAGQLVRAAFPDAGAPAETSYDAGVQ